MFHANNRACAVDAIRKAVTASVSASVIVPPDTTRVRESYEPYGV